VTNDELKAYLIGFDGDTQDTGPQIGDTVWQDGFPYRYDGMKGNARCLTVLPRIHFFIDDLLDAEAADAND
jgi:hypothetical protein